MMLKTRLRCEWRPTEDWQLSPSNGWQEWVVAPQEFVFSDIANRGIAPVRDDSILPSLVWCRWPQRARSLKEVYFRSKLGTEQHRHADPIVLKVSMPQHRAAISGDRTYVHGAIFESCPTCDCIICWWLIADPIQQGPKEGSTWRA
jgi:hypothetical protein